MAKNKRKNKQKGNQNSFHHEDYYDLRNTTKRPAKHKRVKDKKYLKDMDSSTGKIEYLDAMRGDIDLDSYHEYNGN